MKKNMIIIVSIIVIIVIGIIVFCSKKTNKDYYYEASLNENMINYNLIIVDGSNLNGNLYNTNGDWLSELKEGRAIINEIDIEGYPDFKIKINEDTYTVKKK